MRFKEFLNEQSLEPGEYYCVNQSFAYGTYSDEEVRISVGEKVNVVKQYGNKVDFIVGYGDEGRRCYKHIETFQKDFISKAEHDLQFFDGLSEEVEDVKVGELYVTTAVMRARYKDLPNEHMAYVSHYSTFRVKEIQGNQVIHAWITDGAEDPDLLVTPLADFKRDTITKATHDRKFLDDLQEATSPGTGTPGSVLSRAFKEICDKLQSEMPVDPETPDKHKEKLKDFIGIGSMNASYKSPPNAERVGGYLEKKKIKSVTVGFSGFKFQGYSVRSSKWGRKITNVKPSVKTTEEHRIKVKQLQLHAIQLFMKKCEELGFHIIGWIDGKGSSSLQKFEDLKTLNLAEIIGRIKDKPTNSYYDSEELFTLIFDGDVITAKSPNEIMTDVMKKLREKLHMGGDPETAHRMRRKKGRYDDFSTSAVNGYRGTGHGTGWYSTDNPIIIYPPVFKEIVEVRDLLNSPHPDTSKIDFMLNLADDDSLPQLQKDRNDLVTNHRALTQAKLNKIMAKVRKDIDAWNEQMPAIGKQVEAAISEIAASSPYEIKVEVKTDTYIDKGSPYRETLPTRQMTGALDSRVGGNSRNYLNDDQVELVKDYMDMLCIRITVGDRKS